MATAMRRILTWLKIGNGDGPTTHLTVAVVDVSIPKWAFYLHAFLLDVCNLFLPILLQTFPHQEGVIGGD